jgi:hypothetical protein
VQESIGPVLSGLSRERQRLVDARHGRFHTLAPGFDLGQETSEDWHPKSVSLIAVRR